MIALIDADILAHKIAFSRERRMYQVHGRTVTFAYKKDAVAWCHDQGIKPDLVSLVRTTDYNIDRLYHAVENMIDVILNMTEAQEYLLCFSGKDVFRHNIGRDDVGNSTYKANRDKHSKPVLLGEVTELLQVHPFTVHPKLEADDLLGIFQGCDSVICSIDKDLLQIPGMHYNINTREFTSVTKKQAERFLWKQVLTGDAVDNIQGLKNVGAITAEKILDKRHVDYHTLVLSEYYERGYKYTDFIQTWAKIYILRRPFEEHPYLDMDTIRRELSFP